MCGFKFVPLIFSFFLEDKYRETQHNTRLQIEDFIIIIIIAFGKGKVDKLKIEMLPYKPHQQALDPPSMLE